MLNTEAMYIKGRLYLIAVFLLLTLLVSAGCKNPWMENILKPFFKEGSSYREIPREYLDFNPATGTITAYTGPTPMGNVIIPATIDGIPVTIIGSNAFQDKGLTGVIIPNSVTIIDGSAFFGNQLTSITIPSSVTSIGTQAFDDNQLTSVTFMGIVITMPAIFTDNDPDLLSLYGANGAGTYTRTHYLDTIWSGPY